MEHSDFFKALTGVSPRRIPHWEHLSCPDAETYLTGIDYYEHPRQCRQKLLELYPQLRLPVPPTDEPKPRPKLGTEEGPSSDSEAHTVRWGDKETGTWEHGESIFKSAEQVFAFSPLEKGDFSDWGFVVEAHDYRSEDVLLEKYRSRFPQDAHLPDEEENEFGVSFYNTLFMWPMLTFGWELFLECCLDERFDRLMEEFKEMNRRVFRCFAKLPIRYVVCHDDIVMTRGPVCSPAWMHKHIFPFYEEIWSMMRDAGKFVVFMADGCMDAFADDVIACGARGIISEPYTDYKAIANRHSEKNLFLAGEGDNRILSRNNPEEIRAMVDRMVETSRLTPGYMMCVGNHIPWNVPPAAIKCYLDYSAEVCVRD